MKLTGLPLILLTALLAALVIAATVLLWSRFGRWRLLTRAAGVVLAEALVVLAVGLVVNRADGFYPSWQALSGDTGTASSTVAAPVGRLDATLGRTSALPWRPAGLASWRLAGAPTVVLPDGYRDRLSVTYPVVLVLTDGPAEVTSAVRAAERADRVVTVVATPTAATRGAALAGLGAALGRDVRVTSHGWGLVTTPRAAPLAAALVNGVPGRYAGEALIGSALPGGLRLPAAVALAVVRPGPPSSSAPSLAGPSLAGPSLAGPSLAGPSLAGPPSSGAPPTSRPPVAPPHVTRKPVVPPHVTRKPGVPPHVTRKPGVPPRVTRSPGGPPPGSAAGKPAAGRVVTLTCPRATMWAVAARWAADQTSSPLQPAILLPVGVR